MQLHERTYQATYPPCLCAVINMKMFGSKFKVVRHPLKEYMCKVCMKGGRGRRRLTKVVIKITTAKIIDGKKYINF